jgi:23S rRNA C2498 (ribose-2'-O)-methylase RlmM
VRSLLPLNGVLGLQKNYDLLMAAMDSNEAEQELCNFCIRKLVYPPRTVTLNCRDCGVLFCGLCSDEIHKQVEFRTHNICLATAENDINGNDVKLGRPRSALPRSGSGRPALRRYNSSLDALPGMSLRKHST